LPYQAANATAPNATVAFDTYITLEEVNILDSTTQDTQFSVCCDDWKYFYFSTASTSYKDLSIAVNLINGTTIYGVYSRVGDCPSFDINDQSNNIDFTLSYYNLPSETVYFGVRGTFDTAYFTISVIQAQQPLTWQIFAIIAGVLVFLIIICFIINRSKRAKQFMNSIRSVRRRDPRPVAPPSYEEEPTSSQYPTESYIEEQRQQRKSARKSNRKSNRRDDDDDY